MTLDIYLENQWLDIDDASSLAITYNFSDLTNPTTQTGDYSTTFTIKGTQHNNAIFGQIWRLDRVTLFGGEFNTSVHFNASKRTNCVIYINHEVFKRGYLKLNTIKSAKGVISYEVTFYSEMVDVLRTLKESKLRDLPFPNDLRHTLNTDNIGAFWDKNSGNSEIAPLLPYLAYVMANNGIYDEFESSKWLTLRNGKYEVETMLNEIQLDECAKREYRSYYQRPALRLKGLIDLIASEHGIQLDPAFFNDSNPYYADSVMALPQYNIMEQTKDYKGLAQYGEDGTDNVITFSVASHNGLIVPSFKSDDGGGIISPTWSDAIEFDATGTSKSEISLEFEFRIIAHVLNDLPAGTTTLFFPRNTDRTPQGILPVVTLDNKGNHTPMTRNIGSEKYDLITQSTGKYQALLYFNRTGLRTAELSMNRLYPQYNPLNHNIGIPIKFTSDISDHRGLAIFTIGIESFAKSGASEDIFPSRLVMQYFVNGHVETGAVNVDYYEVRLYPITKAPAAGGNLNEYYPASAGFTGNDIAVELEKKIRSDYAIDKSDIIDEETTQGDFLINYAKLFGLIFYTDKDGTPHLVTRNTFFKDYKVEDWTQKIDHAKEIQQVPIPFDSKYLLMQYQDGGTHYEDYYRTQYDGEFGGQKINTGFEFNENETDLIPEVMFYNTVMSKERTRMLIGSQYLVDTDPKTLPAMFQREDGGRTPSDTKFNLLFDNGMINIATSNKYIYLTDDNEKMLDESDEVKGGKICWLDVSTVPIQDTTDTLYQPRNQYPQFSTLHKSGAFSWHLGYPLENYAGWMRSDFPESSTIYANFWRNYIAEIYDVDNRIMTAYVRLTAADIAQFSFANFVKIGDALWHVNKIEQFDPLSNGTTKVEFLRVSSLAAIENAYKNGQTDMSAIIPPEPARYDVVLQLTHITSSTDDTNVEEGETFTAILDADTGYKIDSIVVTMGNTDITSQTIGGVKVWQLNANNSGGTLTIAGVTDEVNIVASAVQVQPDNYRTIKVYSDIEDAIVESNGVRYTHLSMDTPAEIKVYWGDGVTDGITIDYSQAGNLAGTPVLIYGFPKTSGSTIEVWDMVVTPSRIDSSGEFYEYDDTDGDMEFDDGKTYVITALPAIGVAKGIVVQGLVNQSISSYNGRTWTTLFNNTTADSVNMDIPADSVAIQFWNMGDRDILHVDNVMFAFYGLGTGIVVPAAYLKDKNSIYIDYDHV